ncbi:hypothetical protein [Sediminicoccus sp. KRV36]|uniref:hypothetical protein n=1 Tax=Sediminicoccus sp. KRV36 TaxID=3133721 RepID=UPI00200F22B5|nr:hypothetical protein [Sediminicoccus rosea]UPY39214.1 hypothetical protein LHU95_11110 [Sediminicoccus rosea]
MTTRTTAAALHEPAEGQETAAVEGEPPAASSKPKKYRAPLTWRARWRLQVGNQARAMAKAKRVDMKTLRRIVEGCDSRRVWRNLQKMGLSARQAAGLMAVEREGAFFDQLIKKPGAKPRALAAAILAREATRTSLSNGTEGRRNKLRRDDAQIERRPSACPDTRNRFFRTHDEVEAQQGVKDPWVPGVIQPHHPARIPKPEVPPFVIWPSGDQ